MTRFSSAYDPQKHEQKIYQMWEQGGAFKPQEGSTKDYFSIVAPPPNANGNLHIGHGLTMAIEDVATRYNRMLGKATLFVPGADHAGFETQVVYEKQLAKEGKSRFDFTREQLYKQIWEFVGSHRSTFDKQFRRLGASMDWDYFTFTLDDKVIKQAYSTFKKMWDDGLIYRGERLVNFCTFHGTAFSDYEVEFSEDKGHIWEINYPLTDGSGQITVATTRPETMLGDTAIAVNPKDKRYAKFIGKTAKLPLTNREIPILADEMVDINFGTGAVKITPAHDPNDFEVAQRHDLPMITVIDHEGKMNHEVPEKYHGLTVEDARKQVVADLKEQGILGKVQDYSHSVGHCYKCGTVIQPLLREQWFIDMQPLAKRAIKSLEAKEITFYPDSKRKQLITYLGNLRDWNISRQIAWGIPIPAFQNTEDPSDWIFHEGVDQETIQIKNKTYRRDPDVFDTWFSSSTWPYSTLNYPDGEAFKKFYPLKLMETGGEILYPWVSRMIMLGLYETDQVPFENVYIHGYVMAEGGAKMSKSLGNVINPLEVIDKYGSDSLRMGIMAGRVPAVNRGYDPRKVEDARNFCNKLWNIARYIDGLGHKADGSINPTTLADHWILSQLSKTISGAGRDMDKYRLAEAYEKIYHFIWDDFADWYLEASKAEQNPAILAHILESSLKLLHPFAPFVTETIWQELGWRPETMLINQDWPKSSNNFNTTSAKNFEQLRQIIGEIRSINLALGASKLTLSHSGWELIETNAEIIKKLAKVGDISSKPSGNGMRITSASKDLWLEVDAETAKSYIQKLKTAQTASEQVIANFENRLKNKSYVDNAPKHLVDETKTQLEAEKAKLENILSDLKIFS